MRGLGSMKASAVQRGRQTFLEIDGTCDPTILNRALNRFAGSPDDLGLVVRFTITTPADFAEKYPDELARFAVTNGAAHIGHSTGNGDTRLFRKVRE
jgi:hypothetical protein